MGKQPSLFTVKLNRLKRELDDVVEEAHHLYEVMKELRTENIRLNTANKRLQDGITFLRESWRKPRG